MRDARYGQTRDARREMGDGRWETGTYGLFENGKDVLRVVLDVRFAA